MPGKVIICKVEWRDDLSEEYGGKSGVLALKKPGVPGFFKLYGGSIINTSIMMSVLFALLLLSPFIGGDLLRL